MLPFAKGSFSIITMIVSSPQEPVFGEYMYLTAFSGTTFSQLGFRGGTNSSRMNADCDDSDAKVNNRNGKQINATYAMVSVSVQLKYLLITLKKLINSSFQ